MSGIIKNRLTRGLKNSWNNFWLKRRHKGLVIGEGAHVVHSTFGRYNMLCGGSAISNSSLGDYSYIGIRSTVNNTQIGRFCSIGPDVAICLGMHPSRDFVSTHPVFFSTSFPCENRFADRQGFVEYGNVTIGHDVWVGSRATIMANVNVGTGAVIAAGAVVTKDVEPYSIVGGVPAKTIRKRFGDSEIQQLLDSKWWEFSDVFLAQNYEAFHSMESFVELISHQSNPTDAGPIIT